MATCIELFEIAYAEARNLGNFEGAIENVRRDIYSATFGPPASRISKIEDYKNQVVNIKNKLQALLAQAKQGTDSNCPAAIRDIEKFIAQADSVISKANAAQNETRAIAEENAKEEAEAAAAAASKTNNQGTGTPGTAGTGPDATPAPAPSPTTVTGPAGPAGASAESGTGATGPQPVVDDPAIPTEDIGLDPNINLGEDPPQPEGSSQGLDGATTDAQQGASRQDAIEFARAGDWRVRLALAPNAKYLYDVKQGQNAGILAPLRVTDGVIFPYTPNISISYAASYEPTSVTHSNYKIFQYQNSSVDNISISCDFTAQDTYEANYLLAVIHFFRTVTKMFYGQDQNPKAGTPPPLCYLYGLGQFQFNAHPLVITNFAYNLPTDVDYIRADSVITDAIDVSSGNTPTNTTPDPSSDRLAGADASLAQGGTKAPPVWRTVPSGTTEPTYVPTKINLQITAVPVVSRNDISNRFSVKKYATGELLKGIDNPTSGGIW